VGTAGTTALRRLLFLGGVAQPRRQFASMALRVTTTTDTLEAEGKLIDAIKALPGTDMTTETVSSFYWWDGGVQHDDERRISFGSERLLDDILAEVGKAHNYDVPMIVADGSDAASLYWKGMLSVGSADGAAALADRLVAGRLVACAQVSSDGSVALKTTAKAKPAVDRMVGQPVAWVPIEGNRPYLDWLDEETRAAAGSEESCA